MRTLRFPLALLLATALACGGDDDDPTDPETDASEDATEDTADAGGEDVEEDTEEDVEEDVPEDAPADIPDTGGDVPVDAGEDVAADVEEDAEPNRDQCVGNTDSFLLAHGDDDAQVVALTCATEVCDEAENVEECVAECVAEIGLSDGCSGCMAEAVVCAFDACPDECEVVTSEACGVCANAACGARREECIGEIGDVPVPAWVSVVNVAEFGAVSAWIASLSVPLVDDLGIGEGVRLALPPSGDPVDAIDFRLADSSPADSILGSATPEFGYAPDTFHVAGLFGDDGDVGGLWIREDPSSPPDGVRYRFVNAAVRGQINIWEITNAMEPVFFVQNLEFGTAQNDAGRAPGDMQIAIDDDQDDDFDAEFDLGNIPGDAQRTFWIGEDEDGRFILAVDIDGTFTRHDELIGE